MANEGKSKSKSKNKNINKVKIFLANPSKPKCPSLEDADLQQLEHLLTKAIDESKQSPVSFATAAHICLGLESSLRTINNGKAACVLLSTSIKPRYLLGLVARNVEIIDETVPTYTQTRLEDVTKKIFGVKALAMVLPKLSKNLGAELAKWIEEHRKPKKPKHATISTAVKTTKKNIKISRDTSAACEQLKALAVATDQVGKKVEVTPFRSDYISFSRDSGPMDVDEVDSEEDENKLLNVLDQIAKKAKQCTETIENVSSEVPVKVDLNISSEVESNNSDIDKFLSDYAPLTVHKIRPNPDRKPRKKRKKNANKQQNKK